MPNGATESLYVSRHIHQTCPTVCSNCALFTARSALIIYIKFRYHIIVDVEMPGFSDIQSTTAIAISNRKLRAQFLFIVFRCNYENQMSKVSVKYR